MKEDFSHVDIFHPLLKSSLPVLVRKAKETQLTFAISEARALASAEIRLSASET